MDQVGDVGVGEEYLLWLYSNGSVWWWPDFKWKTVCDINIVYFPFDTQMCNVTFWNPVQLIDGVHVELHPLGPELFDYMTKNSPENNAWDLVNYSLHKEIVYDVDVDDNGQTDQLSKIWFTLVLRRRP